MGKIEFAGRNFHFRKRDIKIRIDMDNFGLELLAVRKNGVQGFFL